MSDVKPTSRPSNGNLTTGNTSPAKTTSTANPASSPRVGSRQFDPTSATYHQALRNAGYITDAQLAAATSGDRTDMEKADKEALLLGSLNSQRSSRQGQSKSIDGSGKTKRTEQSGTTFLKQHRKRDELLRKNYAKQGYTFVNSKSKNHNCLITSLLQHATNGYGKDHADKAKIYREALNANLKKDLTEEQKKKFWDNDLLDADNIPWLLEEMAKDATLTNKGLRVKVWTANDEGEPISITFGKGETEVILFNSTDHFEAVLPPRNVGEKKGGKGHAAATTTATSATTTTTSRTSSSTANAIKNPVKQFPGSKPLARNVTQSAVISSPNDSDESEFKFDSFDCG